MLNTKRLAALIMCALLVLAVFVSSACIAINAEHDCTGHGCDICARIEEARTLLNGLALLCALIALFAACALRGCSRAAGRACLPAFVTLTGWKIRLNN